MGIRQALNRLRRKPSKRPRIKLVISVTNGRITKDYQVNDDKRKDGLKNMTEHAMFQAHLDPEMGDGPLWVVTNWQPKERL